MGACPYGRFVVVGATGSGKSTLAMRLSRSFKVDFIELDALYWEPNWKEAPLDIFRARTGETARPQAWVVACNYREVRDLVWPRADAIVWLGCPLPLVFWRLTSRIIRRAVAQENLRNGNRETFWPHLKFWSARSLFHWLFKTYRRYKREYPMLFVQPAHAHLTAIRLRSPREAEAWLGRFAPESRA